MIITNSSLRKAAVAVALATTTVAFATANASATTVQKIGGGPFSGLSAVGSTATFVIGGLLPVCNGSSLSAINGTGTDGIMRFHQTFNDCSLDFGAANVCAATFDTPGEWTRTFTGTPVYGARLSIGSTATFTVDEPGCGYNGCVLTLSGGPFTGGTATNDLSGPPGIRVGGSSGGISWTSTPVCGTAASGTNAQLLVDNTKIRGLQIVS